MKIGCTPPPGQGSSYWLQHGNRPLHTRRKPHRSRPLVYDGHALDLRGLSGLDTACLLVRCGGTSPVAAGQGGGSTETTNGIIIAGVTRSADGTIATQASINVRSRSYLPYSTASDSNAAPQTPDTVTASDGSFRFIIPDTFATDLVVHFADKSGNIAAQSISLAQQADSLYLGAVALQPPSAITGVIDSSRLQGSVFVAVRGSDRWTQVRQDGTFHLDRLPAGDFSLHCTADHNAGAAGVDYAVSIPAASTLRLETPLPMVELQEDLAVWWSCDMAEGDTIHDLVTGQYNVILEGATIGNGKLGKAMLFDESGEKATVQAPITPSDSGSFAFWLNASLVDTTGIHRVISADTSSFEIGIRQGHPSNELFALSTRYLTDIKTTIEPHRWYHLVCTWNAITHEQRIYIDGSLSATKIAADDPPGPVTLTFGRGAYINDTDHQPFYGLLDDIRIYSTVLGDRQIRALAMGGR